MGQDGNRLLGRDRTGGPERVQTVRSQRATAFDTDHQVRQHQQRVKTAEDIKPPITVRASG